MVYTSWWVRVMGDKMRNSMTLVHDSCTNIIMVHRLMGEGARLGKTQYFAKSFVKVQLFTGCPRRWNFKITAFWADTVLLQLLFGKNFYHFTAL